MNLYLAAKLMGCVVNWSPPSWCRAAGGIIGEVIYGSWPRGRRNMKQAIAALMGADISSVAVSRTARRCFRNYCHMAFDFLRFSFSGHALKESDFRIQGKHHLDAALAKNRGVILVSFHLGSFDLGIKVIGQMGYLVNVVANRVGFQQIDDMVRRCRSSSGVKVLQARNSLPQMTRALHRNEILILMLDCPQDSKCINIQFGKKVARVPVLAATLARRTGASVIPCGIVRSPDGVFYGFFEGSIDPQFSGNHALDIAMLTKHAFYTLALKAAQLVDQWYIFHAFFQDVVPGTRLAMSEDSEQVFNETMLLEVPFPE